MTEGGERKAGGEDTPDEHFLVDIASNRKLRRLGLSEKDEERLPVKRYFGPDEFADAVNKKMKRNGGWLTSVKNAEIVVTAPPEKVQATGQINVKKYKDPTRGNEYHKGPITACGFIGCDALWSTGRDGVAKIYSLEDESMRTSIRIKASENGVPAVVRTATYDPSRNVLYCIASHPSVGVEGGELFGLDLTSNEVIKIPSVVNRGATRTGSQYSTVICCNELRNTLLILERTGRILQLDTRTDRPSRIYNSGSINKAICFNPYIPSLFYSGDVNGELFTWNSDHGRCIDRKTINITLGIQSLAWSGQDRLLAGGLSECIASLDAETKEVVKTFDNLKAVATTLVGHPYAHVALAASDARPNGAKLIHSRGKGFVYQNWPSNVNKVVNLQHVTAACFSSFGGWMALGNDTGSLKLWNLKDLASLGEDRALLHDFV